MVTLSQVCCFLAATETGSFAAAASALGLSEHAVSDRIDKLQDDLDIVLLTRSKEGVQLTEAGTKFLPHARGVAVSLAAAHSSVSDDRDLSAGPVAFGLFSHGTAVLPELVPAFRQRYPATAVKLLSANSAHIADLIRAGQLEAGVVGLPINDRALSLLEGRWSGAVAYFHRDPTVTAHPVKIDDIITRPLVLSQASWSHVDPTRRELATRAQTRALRLRADVEVESAEAALSIAATGVAGAVVSIPLAQALGYTRSLSYASFDPPLVETYAIASRHPQMLSATTRAMVDLVRQHMRMLHTQL